MTQRIPVFLPLSGMIASMAISQVLFKMAGLHVNHQSDPVAGFVLNPWLWIGLLTSGIGMICWLLTLRRIPLSKAYPWTALIYIITPLAGLFLFQETLSVKYLFGMSLIVFGVYLSTSGAATE